MPHATSYQKREPSLQWMVGIASESVMATSDTVRLTQGTDTWAGSPSGKEKAWGLEEKSEAKEESKG